MNHGSLYSGIGGWLLAARWAGIQNVFTCEIDNFCNKVLDKHFPETDRHYDIKETDFKKYRGAIDILSTSDPCQPFSFAGKRGGKADDRYLWPQTIRVIREAKPAYAVFENVPGFISLGFETVASDLEAEGYTVESFVIPACGVGAWHRRDRLWVIAYTKCSAKGQTGYSDTISKEWGSIIQEENKGRESTTIQHNGLVHISGDEGKDVPDTRLQRQEKYEEQTTGIEQYSKENGNGSYRAVESQLGGMVDGLSYWLHEPDIPRVAIGVKDRVNRLKALGNSIVPQIAFIIFEAIKQVETNSL